MRKKKDRKPKRKDEIENPDLVKDPKPDKDCPAGGKPNDGNSFAANNSEATDSPNDDTGGGGPAPDKPRG